MSRIAGVFFLYKMLEVYQIAFCRINFVKKLSYFLLKNYIEFHFYIPIACRYKINNSICEIFWRNLSWILQWKENVSPGPACKLGHFFNHQNYSNFKIFSDIVLFWILTAVKKRRAVFQLIIWKTKVFFSSFELVFHILKFAATPSMWESTHECGNQLGYKN